MMKDTRKRTYKLFNALQNLGFASFVVFVKIPPSVQNKSQLEKEKGKLAIKTIGFTTIRAFLTIKNNIIDAILNFAVESDTTNLNGSTMACWSETFNPASEGRKNKPTTIQASEGDSSISLSSEGETKKNLDDSDKEVDREEIKNLRNVHS